MPNRIRQISSTARDVMIAVNPHAGARSRDSLVEAISTGLRQAGMNVQRFEQIDELVPAVEKQLAAGTLRAVVAAGGDGTLRLIAGRTPPGTPLAVLPLGTENLLAKYLEITTDPQALCRIITEGYVVRMDAGEANGRLFSLMAGCGFDADVVRRVHRQRTGHIHHLSYAKPILDALRNYEYPELRVYYRKNKDLPALATPETVGEYTHEITARWVFVVNLPRYARGLNFAPEASGTDGLLDVCTFKSGSLWSSLWYLGSVVIGQHQAMEDFCCVRTDRLRIEAAEPVPFQLDGDMGGELPLEVRTLPGRLTLLVSPTWAMRQGYIAEGA